jgi:hypothetical protein
MSSDKKVSSVLSSDKKVSSSTNLSGKLAAVGVAERNGLLSPQNGRTLLEFPVHDVGIGVAQLRMPEGFWQGAHNLEPLTFP